MANIRNCRISGYGAFLPDNVVKFGEHTRYRIADDMTHLEMLTTAAQRALDKAGIAGEDLDCIIGASAAGVQPIPCTAALIAEQIAPLGSAAALDINSTCTSMITAFDIASRYIADGTYRTVLVTAGDVGSRFLNPEQKESYSLFSDCAVAFVLTATKDPAQGVITSYQRTWPKHAHETEIRGGLSRLPAQEYAVSNPADFLFDMNGRAALRSMIKVLPQFFTEFFATTGLEANDFDLVIPHQASPALKLAMSKIGIPEAKYINWVQDIGNMVSSSVGYVLIKSLEDGTVKEGDTVLLCGTAAGLTANALALRL